MKELKISRRIRAFSKLFLSFEYDEKSKVLFIVRKSRKSAAGFYGAVSASGAEFSYSIGRDDKKENIDGCCVEPEITLTVRGSVSARFVICCGYSKERLLKDLKASERFEPARSINALNYADRLRGLLYPYGGSGQSVSVAQNALAFWTQRRLSVGVPV